MHFLTWPSRYGDLLRYLVRRDLAVRYRRSAIGFLWTMLQPLMTLAVIYVVFSYLFSDRLPDYPVYVLSGLLWWNFVSQGITSGMTSLQSNKGLLVNFPLPSEIFVISATLAGLVNLALSLIPLLVILLVVGHPISPALLFLPVSMAIAFTVVLGLSLALAPMAVFFSDVVELTRVILQMLYFAVPVMFPVSILPESKQWIMTANPLYSSLRAFRDPIYLGRLPDLEAVLISLLLAAVSLSIGAYFLGRSRNQLHFHL